MLSEDKIKLLMDYFDTNDMETLKARCCINMNKAFYNELDNEEFMMIVKYIDEMDDWEIIKDLHNKY